jgi:PAS domain-containing protein
MFREFVTYSEKNGIDFSINGLTLAFKDPETESNFNKAYFESSLPLLRACHLIAVFFYCLVGGWNVFLIDPSLLGIWVWVASVVTLLFVLGLASTYLAPHMYARYWQQISALYVLVTGLGFSVVAVMSGPHYPVYNFVGVIFCLFFCYAFIRLFFVWATLAGNAIVGAYAVSTGLFTELPTGLVMSSFFYMFGISLLGMMVSYSIELMARRDFMLQELLRREEKKTKDINDHLEERVKERTEALREANREIQISFEREKRLVSELEKEEKKLQHSLASLEQAESIGKLGYFERNWQSGERYWSKGFLRLLGYEKGQKAASHDTFGSFVHEEDRKRVAEHIQRCARKS